MEKKRYLSQYFWRKGAIALLDRNCGCSQFTFQSHACRPKIDTKDQEHSFKAQTHQ